MDLSDDMEYNTLKYAKLGEKLLNERFKEKAHYWYSSFKSPMYESSLFSDYRVIFNVGENTWEEGYQVQYGIFSKHYGTMTNAIHESTFDFESYARMRSPDNSYGELTPSLGPMVEIIDSIVILGNGGVDFTIPELGTLFRSINSAKKFFDAYYASSPESAYNETKLYAFGGVTDGLWAYLYICCESGMTTHEILDYYHTPQMQAKVKSWFLKKGFDKKLVDQYKKLYLSITRSDRKL